MLTQSLSLLRIVFLRGVWQKKKKKNLSQTLPQHKVASAVRRGSCQSTKSWHIVVLLPPIFLLFNLQLLWPKEKSLTTLRLEQSTEKCFLCLISL